MRRVAFLAATLLGSALGLKAGDRIPSVNLDYGFPPEKIDLAERVAKKNVILVGLPGAFTPTWSTRQVPGYLEQADALKSLGVDEVIVYCVNDGAVMSAWAEDQGVARSGLITMMGDPTGELTGTLDLFLDHPGPQGKGLINRCKRFAAYLEDGVVKVFRVAEADDDPAGDDRPEVTLAPAMMAEIRALKDKTEL